MYSRLDDEHLLVVNYVIHENGTMQLCITIKHEPYLMLKLNGLFEANFLSFHFNSHSE